MAFYHMPLWETEHWWVKLAEDQTYLGRGVVAAKSVRTSMSELTAPEMVDLLEYVVRPYEAAVKAAFGADLFNWSCLMNLAYQNDPPDPHVHWHLKPRYRKPVVFEGETFVDEAFGHHYEPGTMRRVSDVLARKIVGAILAHRVDVKSRFC